MMSLVLKKGFWLPLLTGAVFAALAFTVRAYPVLSFDVAISRWVQAWGAAGAEGAALPFSPFMAAASFFGIPWVASASILSAALIFLMLSYRREALFVLGVFVADAVGTVVKMLVARPRPTPDLVRVLESSDSFAFPSGHVVHYIVLFGFLAAVFFFIARPPQIVKRVIWALFVALIVAVSLSRIYLGVHWATDVIGGYLLGFIMLWLLFHAYKTHKAH